MILTVTPNPAWDVTYRLPRLVPGEALRVRSTTAQAGGKGLNVARVVMALGGTTHVLAPVGGVTGDRMRRQLDSVPATWISIDAQTRTSVAVIPDEPGVDGGHPTVFNEPGPPVSTSEWELLVSVMAGLAQRADAVAIAGSLPTGVDQEMWARLLAAAGSTPTFVDTSGDALIWTAAAGATVVKANLSEAAAATGADDLASAAAALRALGAGSVLLTDGARGLGLFDNSGITWARCDAEVYGNPTGAGDAALAAFALRYDAGPTAALAYAAAVSTASVFQELAGAVDPDDVARLISRVKVRNTPCS